jgi:hypothetical protein
LSIVPKVASGTARVSSAFILSFGNLGTNTIILSQGGNGNYLAAPTITNTVIVIKGNQLLPSVTNTVQTGTTVALPSTTSNNTTITYSSSDTTIATISGNKLSIKKIGAFNLIAKAAATALYNAASATNAMNAVSPQKVTPPKIKSPLTYSKDLSIPLGASAATGTPVVFSSDSPLVADIDGSNLLVMGAGTATITAFKGATASHASGIASTKIVIRKAPQTITFKPVLSNSYSPGGVIAFVASSSSGLPVTYSSNNAQVLSISDSDGLMTGKGSVTVTASQAGDSNYLPAKSVAAKLVIR